VRDEPRYAIGDLADLGGVSRRTVRYYVQEGLLPAPLGLGRGNHYGQTHLDRLLQVKALQEAGRSLEEIRRALDGDPVRHVTLSEIAPEPALPPREIWRRLTLAPGVELHLSGDVRMAPPGKLNELANWCRALFPARDDGRDNDE
jgi:DNA-binding transcriptional MerR regulator